MKSPESKEQKKRVEQPGKKKQSRRAEKAQWTRTLIKIYRRNEKPSKQHTHENPQRKRKKEEKEPPPNKHAKKLFFAVGKTGEGRGVSSTFKR